ncbi:caspase family protein [Marinomonas sp.]|uniref:caspase family protein n=1 Tax=Marinomonas sp. TaxID=1904862 RepID=UPI003BAB2081
MTITRKAILIGAPSVKPELPGVNVDVRDIKNHLLSNKGGAWKESEITILIDPSPYLVKAHIDQAEDKDYVFITCSGHGEHRVGGNIDDTVMYLNEDDTIAISEVNPRNKRHLVVVDVCRKIVEVKKEYSTAMNKFAMENFNESHIDYRAIFDNAIMSTAEGRIVTYSCEINQAAGDNGQGGVFTQALLKTPGVFSRPSGRSYGVLDINAAFEHARDETYRQNAPQKPVLNAGRRRDFYPFAIV